MPGYPPVNAASRLKAFIFSEFSILLELSVSLRKWIEPSYSGLSTG